MTITMFDSVDVSQIPADAQAVAGYTGGRWPTYSSLLTRFPRALHLSVAISASEDASCLDIEKGDATPAQAPGWVQRQMALKTWRPALYASVSTMPGVRAALAAASINANMVRFWTAHYGRGEHICGPQSCGELPWNADGTQWTDLALGRNLDQSLLDSSFFQQENTLMTIIPIVRQGSTGQAVKNWQALLVARGYALGVSGERKDGIDGVFGPVTEAMTREFQAAARITADGIVGPQTWTAALTA